MLWDRTYMIFSKFLLLTILFTGWLVRADTFSFRVDLDCGFLPIASWQKESMDTVKGIFLHWCTVMLLGQDDIGCFLKLDLAFQQVLNCVIWWVCSSKGILQQWVLLLCQRILPFQWFCCEQIHHYLSSIFLGRRELRSIF